MPQQGSCPKFLPESQLLYEYGHLIDQHTIFPFLAQDLKVWRSSTYCFSAIQVGFHLFLAIGAYYTFFWLLGPGIPHPAQYLFWVMLVIACTVHYARLDKPVTVVRPRIVNRSLSTGLNLHCVTIVVYKSPQTSTDTLYDMIGR